MALTDKITPKKEFEYVKQLDCPSPVTSPKFLGTVVEELEKVFNHVDPNLIKWFGPGLEQGPFERIKLNKCRSLFKLSQERASMKMPVKPKLMQLLLAAKDIASNLKKSGDKIIAYPEERYGKDFCQVVFIREGSLCKIYVNVLKPKKTAPKGTPYVVVSSSDKGMEFVSFPEADNPDPKKKLDIELFFKSDALHDTVE